MGDPTAPPETDAPDLEDWAGRYLDLFQRNWTAWLESTPAMIRAALATADKSEADPPESAEIHDIAGRGRRQERA